MSSDGHHVPRYTQAHELAHELTSLRSRPVTYRNGDEFVERMLVEPADYTADVYDGMIDFARRKIAEDQPPPDELTAELLQLLDRLDHRSCLRRAAAATQLATGAWTP
jgi:hypothetical protein